MSTDYALSQPDNDFVTRLRRDRPWGLLSLTGRAFHHFERRAFDPAELFVQERDSRIGRDRDGPIEAVVRDEYAVLLQALQDRLRRRREAADVEILFRAGGARPCAAGWDRCPLLA